MEQKDIFIKPSCNYETTMDASICHGNVAITVREITRKCVNACRRTKILTRRYIIIIIIAIIIIIIILL